MVEKVGLAFQPPGTTLDEQPFETAEFLAAELGKIVHVQMRIACHEQIHVAVTIIIAPSRARAEPSTADPGLLGDILKFAISQVMVEHVAVVAGHEKVKLAVIIVVSHSNTHTPAEAGEAGFLGNIFKIAIWLLVVKGNHGVPALAQSLYGRTVDHDNVQPVIVVAVKQTDAATR